MNGQDQGYNNIVIIFIIFSGNAHRFHRNSSEIIVVFVLVLSSSGVHMLGSVSPARQCLRFICEHFCETLYSEIGPLQNDYQSTIYRVCSIPDR